MTAQALGHSLETLRDGVTGFAAGEPRSMPLTAMRVEAAIAAGLAVVTTTRSFRNLEVAPVEAVLTFPVAFDSVVTGLGATVDGRTLVAQARDRTQAREAYEEAVGRGKLAVLHEEALKGVHVLSVGNLGAGAEVSVTVETVSALADFGTAALLRIPTTVGELYGTSPLLPADDLVAGPGALTTATVAATTDAGRMLLDGAGPLNGEAYVPLDRPIVLRVEEARFGERSGVDAEGRPVRLALRRVGEGAGSLDCAILFDRSGSTGHPVGRGDTTVWQAMKAGLAETVTHLRPEDRIAIWQFDNRCESLGVACGPQRVAALLDGLAPPQGGTELGAAVETVARAGAQDVLVLTDGQTHASEAQDAAARGCRVSALLVGEGSLDAGVGHLAAMTGGDVVWAPAGEVAAGLARLLAGFRVSGRATTGDVREGEPVQLHACRGGVAIKANWGAAAPTRAGDGADAVGRYAAALALPLLPEALAGAFAAAHGLCTHLTSLVLVDEAGAVQADLPEMRKVPLMQRLGSISPMARVGQSLVMSAPSFDNAEAFSASLRAARQPAAPTPSPPGTGPGNRIDWAALGPGIARGDISEVPPEQILRLRSIVKALGIIELAAALGVDPMIVALALVAEREGRTDRRAQRVANRILGAAPPVMVERAREAFSRLCRV
jgi:hypothetical protein